jgi:acyl-CoA thioesterase FadM
MNLWFRLLAMIARRPWRRPVDPFATTVVRMRVWPTDLDLNRHVTNGRYFTMADLGRMDFVLRTGAWRVALRHRAAPIVGDAWGKFRKELKPFQAFEIHTRMLGWDDKWSFIEHRFVREGRVLGQVLMRGVFRKREGLLCPHELATEMGHTGPSPALPGWVSQWSASCDEATLQLRGEEALGR